MARKSKIGKSSTFFSTLLKDFVKRRKRKGKSSGRGKKRFFQVSIVTCVMLVSGFVFYFFQPSEIKEEIRYLSHVYWTSGRKVSIDEVAWDLWSLYFSREFVESSYQVSSESPVYGGVPGELPAQNRRFLRVLRNRGYWVGYDEKLRNPAWVAYRLFALSEEAAIAPRPESFFPDERTLAQVSSEDYTGSGFDRGHMAPNSAIARCYGREAQEETFLMSNIVPQRHALNAGLWRRLEAREADNYPNRFREIWVLAGPVFREQMPRTLPSGIPIPDAFFKIYLDELNGKLRTIAFLVEHDDDGKGPLEKRLCSIETIQNLTGLDFFPELQPEVQEQLEKEASARVW